MDTQAVVVTTPQKIRVLVVEDYTIVRDGIVHLLNSAPDITVVGAVNSGRKALTLVSEIYPQIDVVLMDLQLPEMDGLATIRKLRGDYKNLKILILTTFVSDEYIFDGIKSGANGYLIKDLPKAELFEALRKVNTGQSVLQPELTNRLFNILSGSMGKETQLGLRTSAMPFTRANNVEKIRNLTAREMEVLKLLIKGDRNKEIALQLGIAESTVKGYIGSIFQKFGVSDRTEAAIYAVQNGLIKVE